MGQRRNRWVTPVEEVRAAERRYAEPADTGVVAHSLQHVYETDPELVAELLPPPLRPGARPEVWVSIGRIPRYDLGVGQVAVRCRYRDEEGWYGLHLPMTTEQAVIGGRERYGENKKIADIRFARDGDRLEGSVTRWGITYLRITGEVVERLDPPEREVVPHYYVKYLLAADGSGYDAPPMLVRSVHTRTPRRLERLEGELELRDSPFDPVADLVVESPGETFYTERTAAVAAKVVEHVDPDAFLPYVYQRDDVAGAG